MAEKKKLTDPNVQPQARGYDDTFGLSANDLEKLSQQIKKDIIEGELDKETWTQERIKDVNAYFGIKQKSDWPFKGAAKISSQMHRIMVDTMAANLVSSANSPEKPIDVKPDNVEAVENAKYVSDLHNQLACYEYKLPQVLDRGLHNALIESFVVLKPVYQNEVQETVLTVKRWLPSDYSADQIQYDVATNTVTDLQGNVIPSLDINGRWAELFFWTTIFYNV